MQPPRHPAEADTAAQEAAAPTRSASVFRFADAVAGLAALIRVHPGDLAQLWRARGHMAAVAHERDDLIVHRVRLLAAVLVPASLLWIVVDALTLPWPYWGEIAWGRVAATPAFLLLALRPRRLCLIGGAGMEVALLIAVPLAFFLYTNAVLSVAGLHGPIPITTTYFYLPFVVAAALAIFPLTILEALLPATMVVGSAAIGVWVWPEFLAGQSTGQTLWRLFVIAFWAHLAGLSQLRFLLRLTEEATRDALTNLLVRGTGEEILENQFAYAMRHDLAFAMLFIDIDRFKSVNDAFGHDAGDAVLRTVATQIARAFRHQDVTIRWGGEEFVVGLPGADLANAEVAVLRLAKLGLGLRPDYRPITASIGIAERQADGIDTLAALVECADARMYEAKKAGRNRYVFRSGPKIWLATQQDPGPRHDLAPQQSAAE